MAVLRNMRPRDEQGWRVPRRGTVSANIYALAKKGLSVTEIATQLGRARSNVGVHLFKIKRPERANQLEEQPTARAQKNHARGSARPQGGERFGLTTGSGARISARRLSADGGQQLGVRVSTD